MGAAWASDDVLKRNRLNRMWFGGGRAQGPMYDVDASDAVTVAATRLAGVLLSNSVTTLYTAPASGVVQIHAITIRNTDTAARAVNLYLVPNGGSAGVAEQVFADTVLPGATTILAPVGGWFLGASGTIRGSAAAASVVALRAELSTYTAQPGGVSLTVVNGSALGTSYGTVYTVPGSGVTHALLLNYTLCNTDTVARAPQITLVESGDTSSAEDEMFGDTLIEKTSAVVDTPLVLLPNDFIQARCAAAGSVVSLRATLLEVA